MFPSKAFLSLILVSLTAVDANSLSRSTGNATLTFTTRINVCGTLRLIEKDQASKPYTKTSTSEDTGNSDVCF